MQQLPPFREIPEHRLWLAVLFEAIKEKDLFWLYTANYDGSFEYVCRVLDMEVDKTRALIRKAWDTSKVNFTMLSPGKMEELPWEKRKRAPRKPRSVEAKIELMPVPVISLKIPRQLELFAQ